MKCKDAERELIPYYYGELDPSAERELKRHLEDCARCKASWDGIRNTLEAVGTDEPEMPDAFWQGYRRKVHEKVKGKRLPGPLRILKPGLAQAFVMILIFLLAGYGGQMLYRSNQEKKFIAENYELIENLELLENMEFFEYLEELNNAHG
jgi:anti-sigma factor RsiW